MHRPSVYICTVLWHTCIVIKGRGVFAGANAPATGDAPARIPNRRRSLAGASAHVCIVLWYTGIVSSSMGRGVSGGALAPATGHAPARIPNHRRSLAGASA